MEDVGGVKVRSFIALELSGEALAEFGRITDILKNSCLSVKWVKASSQHLTLKFLGNVKTEKIEAIADKLKKIALETLSFEIQLGNIGVFPGWGDPRVIWVGMKKGLPKAKLLKDAVDEAILEEGFEKDAREFRPHFTIGRVKKEIVKSELKLEIQKIKVKPISIRISKIILFKSTLHSTGSRYEPLVIESLAGMR